MSRVEQIGTDPRIYLLYLDSGTCHASLEFDEQIRGCGTTDLEAIKNLKTEIVKLMIKLGEIIK